jgi:hypothetical protein
LCTWEAELVQLARGARGMHFVLLVERKEVICRWSSEGRRRIGGPGC